MTAALPEIWVLRHACISSMLAARARRILMDAADVDRDGRIGLSDFRKLSDAAKQHREQQQQQAKAAAEAKKRQPPPSLPQQLLPMVRAPSSGSDKGNNQAEEQDDLA